MGWFFMPEKLRSNLVQALKSGSLQRAGYEDPTKVHLFSFCRVGQGLYSPPAEYVLERGSKPQQIKYL